MSLLMKALEKAAKDRGDAAAPNLDGELTPASSAPPAVSSGVIPGMRKASSAPPKPPSMDMSQLSLEPLPADTPSAAAEPAPASPATKNPPPAAETAHRSPAPVATTVAREQAKAATVMQATESIPFPEVRRRRFSPVMIFGVVGSLAVIGIAVYVYLQITNPALFIPRPPAAPQAPLAQSSQAKPAAQAQPAVAQPPASQSPISTSAVLTPGAPDSAAAATGPAPSAAPATTEKTAPRPVTPPATQRPATASAAAEPLTGIRVSPGSSELKPDQRLERAYAALQGGDLDLARRFYGDVLRADPKHVHALLGTAAIATQDGNADEASRLYFRVLDLDPRNAYAQAGLLALRGRADPLAAESRLKQLISREPLASLHFTLGNLYGDQSRWAEAQQAYFQAYHLEPGNPDYAYNLAVGLEHVGQSRLALGYYRRAVELAQTRGRAGFDPAQAQDRIRQLAPQPE